MKRYYKNIWEWNGNWKEYCLRNNVNLTVNCYEEFISKLDENFLLECEKGVFSDLCCENKYFYWFLVLYQNNMSPKIFDYYKVWKRIKIDIPLLQKGVEKRYRLGGENVYVSVALFDYHNIRSVLKDMMDTQRKSFIYCSTSKTLVDEQESIRIYNKIFNTNNDLMDQQVFLKSICRDMLKDEAVIQLFFDGEEIEMDIFKRC